MKQQDTWETAALGSNAVFDGELDPPALMDGDRKKKKSVLRGVEWVRLFGVVATRTHTQTHKHTIALT